MLVIVVKYNTCSLRNLHLKLSKILY